MAGASGRWLLIGAELTGCIGNAYHLGERALLAELLSDGGDGAGKASVPCM